MCKPLKFTLQSVPWLLNKKSLKTTALKQFSLFARVAGNLLYKPKVFFPRDILIQF